VVTHNWGSIEWAMANAVLPLARHIHIEDGFGPEERDHQIPRRVWTRRVVLRRAEVVLPSQTLLHLARDVWHLPENRLHYVPNGIDLQRFAPHPTALRAELVIGSIAALRPEKNIARLLRAFRLVLDQTPARLVIVGDGPEAASLRALAAELGIAQAVDFTGHQPNPAAALAGFDIFALSSDTEQMPISLLEAMATGLAVAATDVGDVRAMLAPDNRRFVVDRSTVALATALLALATDSTARHHLGAANRVEVAARFDQTTMFATYNALLFPQFTG
jgi:glycosyltransferase involved in cell wall biosynthesis